MDPYRLRTFLAVEKHRSYTRAARELFLSQPAVSRQIRQLEKELGVRLFEQIGKIISPTDAGRTLAREAEALLGDMERVVEAVQGHRGAERGSLRVGASTTPGLYLVPPLIGRFHTRFPAVELSYTIDNSRRIGEAIHRNELDLGFVGVDIADPDLRREIIAHDELVFFTSPTHHLAHRRVPVNRLNDEIWVLREKGSATRELMESRLAERGATIGRSVVLGSPEGVKAIVGSGIGISCLSLRGLQAELAGGRLVRMRVAGVRLERPLYVLRHAGKHVSPTMSAFLQLVRASG